MVNTPKLAIVRATDRTPTSPGRPAPGLSGTLSTGNQPFNPDATLIGHPPMVEDLGKTSPAPTAAHTGRETLHGIPRVSIPQEGMILGGIYPIQGTNTQSPLGDNVYFTTIIGGYGIHHAKLLPVDLATDPQLRTHIKEAEAVAKIEHPNIVKVVAFGLLEKPSNIFIVTEPLQGVNLANLLASDENLTLDRIKDLFSQIFKAVHAAHAKGVAHGDLKPENILLVEHRGSSDVVKIFGFGIAKLMALAQIEGEMPDFRTDIRAIGELIKLLLAKNQDGRPDIQEALNRIVAKTNEKDPARGYRSILELEADMRSCDIFTDTVGNHISEVASEARPDGPKPEIAQSPAPDDFEITVPPQIIKQGVSKTVVIIIALGALVIGGISNSFLNTLLNKRASPAETLVVKREPAPKPAQTPASAPIEKAPPRSVPVPIPVQAPVPVPTQSPSPTPVPVQAPVETPEPIPISAPVPVKTHIIRFTSSLGKVDIYKGKKRVGTTPYTLSLKTGEKVTLRFIKGKKFQQKVRVFIGSEQLEEEYRVRLDPAKSKKPKKPKLGRK